MHPFASVPVTIYVVVDDGAAVTDEPVVLLKPVAGDQLYVLAPLDVSIVDNPAQNATGGEIFTTGIGLTVTVTCVVSEHPSEFPITVYVVVELGLAETEEPVVLLKPIDGLHVYVFAPLAESVPVCPAQMVTGGTVTMGTGFTVTVTCAVAVQPNEVPVTV